MCSPFVRSSKGSPCRAFLITLQPRTPLRSKYVFGVRPYTEINKHDIALCRGHSILSGAHTHRGPEGPAALLLCPAADPGAAPASCRSRGNCCRAHRHSQQRQPGRRRGASTEGASTSAACSAGQAGHSGEGSPSAACSAGQAGHSGEGACGIPTCSVKCPAHAGGPDHSHDAAVELCTLQ